MQILVIIALFALAGLGATMYWKPAPTADTTANMPIIATTDTVPSQQPAGTVPTPSPATNPTPAPTPTPTPVATAPASKYRDGTYTATGSYQSPAGTEVVDVSITLKGDVVTAATFKGNATNPGSVNNQKKFSGGYTAAVVGKKLDSIALTVVNGSSLTPGGFMDALADIKTEARI